MPADQWAQYAEKAPPAGSDPWAKYVQPEVAPNAGLAPPAGGPTNASFQRQTQPAMHESALIGDPNKPTHPPLGEELGEIGKGFVRNIG
jgi:hypothetical protein